MPVQASWGPGKHSEDIWFGKLKENQAKKIIEYDICISSYLLFILPYHVTYLLNGVLRAPILQIYFFAHLLLPGGPAPIRAKTIDCWNGSASCPATLHGGEACFIQ
jgi:hypothetical protein